jgi:hypothetical protein
VKKKEKRKRFLHDDLWFPVILTFQARGPVEQDDDSNDNENIEPTVMAMLIDKNDGIMEAAEVGVVQ